MHNTQDWQAIRRYQCPTCEKRYAVAEWKKKPKCRQCGADLRSDDSQAKPTAKAGITMTNTNGRMHGPLQSKNALELISTSRTSLSNFAATSLALGLTYCRTADLTDSREKRYHLLTRAREALTTAEACMQLAPPEIFTDLLEDADRLRFQIAQLEKEFRTTGCPLRSVPDQGHVVQFYTHDAHLLDSLCKLFADRLREGASVVAAMTKLHGSGVKKRLIARGIDMGGARKKGRLTVLDAEEALSEFMDANRPNRGRFLVLFGTAIRKAEAAALVKNRSVVVFGEMVAVLWAQKKFKAAIRLEELWNELVLAHPLYLCCAYPASEFHGTLQAEPYAKVCAQHTEVVATF